jgi:hypothetical protein
MVLLDRLVALLRFDPFSYLVVTIFAIFVWVWCTAVTGFALTGRGLWLRRGSLVVALLGAVLFAYTARQLH